MNFQILEMLYNIPELQDLSYQIYRQMPERMEREARLAEVWRECERFPDPELQALFDRLEDAENFAGGLQNRASFFAGVYLGWGLSRTLGN